MDFSDRRARQAAASPLRTDSNVNGQSKSAAVAATGATGATGATATSNPGGVDDVFGWDDVFYCVPGSPDRSTHELYTRGFKFTSRDLVVASYIREFVYYKNPVDLKWQPQTGKFQTKNRSIDFGNSVYQFCRHNKYLASTNEWVVHHKIPNIYTAVCNSGVFFRSPKNRRE